MATQSDMPIFHKKRFSLFELLVTVCLCSLCLAVTPALASDLIKSRAVFEDPTNALTFSQVLEEKFLPMKEVLTEGYSESAFWVRLVIDAPPHGGPLKLRILPTVLDEVIFFEQDSNTSSGWRQRVTGDKYAFEAGDRTANSLGFIVFPTVIDHSSVYYLRLKTTSSSVMRVEALPIDEANRTDAISSLQSVVYLGFMAAVLMWACRDFFIYRQTLSGYFIAHHVSNIFSSIALLGYLSPFEPASFSGWVDKVSSLSFLISGICAVLLHREIFRLVSVSKKWIWGLYAVLGCFGGSAALLSFGYQLQAMQSGAITFFVMAFLLCLMAFNAQSTGQFPVRILRIIYSLRLFLFLAALLPLLGWIHAETWTLAIILSHGCLATGLLLYVLTLRSRAVAIEAEEQRRSAELALQQLELEKQYSAEQECFTDMLTHELKTPIGVALMSLGAMKQENNPYLARIRKALKNIDDIVDRTRLSEQAKQKRLTLNITKTNISERAYECIEASTTPERVTATVAYGLEAATDSQLFSVIVSNLIDNALKYSPPNEKVGLRLLTHSMNERAGVLLQVSNQIGSAGIPDPSKIFSKYYRSAGAHNKTGSGLGLYLSQNLTEMIGGKLSYQANFDKVEFELWLPT